MRVRTKEEVHDYWYETSVPTRIAEMATYLAMHDGPSDGYLRSPEGRYFEGLLQSFNEYGHNKRALTDTANWNFGKLKRKDTSSFRREITTYSKPKILLDIYTTTKGNLTVRWEPRYEDREMLRYGDYHYAVQAPYRPMNELMFVRSFDLVGYSVGREEPGKETWTTALRLQLLELTFKMVDDIIEDLRVHCDVTVNHHYEITRGDDHRIADIEPVNLQILGDRAERKREMAEITWEREKAAALREFIKNTDAEFDNFERRYGLPPRKLIGILDGIRAHKVPFPEAVDLMSKHYGTKMPAADENFVGITRAIRRTLRDRNIEVETFALSKDEVAALRGNQKKVSSSAPTKIETPEAKTPSRAMATRIRSMVLPKTPFDPKSPPDYSKLKAFNDLAMLGGHATDAAELVDKVNAELAARGQFPITQSDYPTSRKKLERLVERWNSLEQTNPSNNR